MTTKFNQMVARQALGRFTQRLNTPGEPDPYEFPDSRDILGEDDRGTIFAPRAGSTDWWEAFDFRKPGHMAAWSETRRTGRLAFLELESGVSDD
jgi:hypothetical protein